VVTPERFAVAMRLLPGQHWADKTGDVARVCLSSISSRHTAKERGFWSDGPHGCRLRLLGRERTRGPTTPVHYLGAGEGFRLDAARGESILFAQPWQRWPTCRAHHGCRGPDRAGLHRGMIRVNPKRGHPNGRHEPA